MDKIDLDSRPPVVGRRAKLLSERRHFYTLTATLASECPDSRWSVLFIRRIQRAPPTLCRFGLS